MGLFLNLWLHMIVNKSKTWVWFCGVPDDLFSLISSDLRFPIIVFYSSIRTIVFVDFKLLRDFACTLLVGTSTAMAFWINNWVYNGSSSLIHKGALNQSFAISISLYKTLFLNYKMKLSHLHILVIDEISCKQRFIQKMHVLEINFIR
jgi:hypothetical protein